jgi:hypothetical protein
MISEDAAKPSIWEDIYRAAVLETDHGKLAEKIEAANVVISQRLVEIGAETGHAKERQRLTDALLTIDTIRRIEFKAAA